MASTSRIISSVRHQGQKEYKPIPMAGLPLVNILVVRTESFNSSFFLNPNHFRLTHGDQVRLWRR